MEICKKYHVEDAEEFVDSWMAYSVSHFHGENPTIAHLGKFERDEYAKKTKDAPPMENDRKSSLIIYEANKMEFDLYPFATLIPIINVIFFYWPIIVP